MRTDQHNSKWLSGDHAHALPRETFRVLPSLTPVDAAFRADIRRRPPDPRRLGPQRQQALLLLARAADGQQREHEEHPHHGGQGLSGEAFSVALEPNPLVLVAFSPRCRVCAERHRGAAQPGEQVDHLPEGQDGVLGPGGRRHGDSLRRAG